MKDLILKKKYINSDMFNVGIYLPDVSLEYIKIFNTIKDIKLYSFYDETNKHIVQEIKDYVGDDGIVITTKAQNHGHVITK